MRARYSSTAAAAWLATADDSPDAERGREPELHHAETAGRDGDGGDEADEGERRQHLRPSSPVSCEMPTARTATSSTSHSDRWPMTAVTRQGDPAVADEVHRALAEAAPPARPSPRAARGRGRSGGRWRLTMPADPWPIAVASRSLRSSEGEDR